MHTTYLWFLAGMVVSGVAPGWLKAVVAGAALLVSGALLRLDRIVRRPIRLPHAKLPSRLHVRATHLSVVGQFERPVKEC